MKLEDLHGIKKKKLVELQVLYGKEKGGVLSMDDQMKKEELKTEMERLAQLEEINCNRS